jgi:hypothetical protein
MKKPRDRFDIEKKPLLKRLLREVNAICAERQGLKSELAKRIGKGPRNMPYYIGTEFRPPRRELRAEHIFIILEWLELNRRKKRPKRKNELGSVNPARESQRSKNLRSYENSVVPNISS